MTTALPEIPHRTADTGDVVELILADHRFFEDCLRELRNDQNDRDALRRLLSEVLVAHGEAEEREVYGQLERRDAIDEHEAEHGEEEHRDIHEALLPLLEATDLLDEDFSHAVHELSETVLHHLDEEERDILNPARSDVAEADRARLGAAWLVARRELLDQGCGSAAQVRALLDA